MKRLIAVMAIFLCGCSVTQIRQEVFGLSIQDVKSMNGYTQAFDMNASDAFDQTINILKEKEANILRKDKNALFIGTNNLVKIYPSCVDTTEAGILFTSIAPNKTEVRVASGSSPLAEFMSKYLPRRLMNPTEKDASEK